MEPAKHVSERFKSSSGLSESGYSSSTAVVRVVVVVP